MNADSKQHLDLSGIQEPDGCPPDLNKRTWYEPGECPPTAFAHPHKYEYVIMKMSDGSTKRLIKRNFRMHAREYYWRSVQRWSSHRNLHRYHWSWKGRANDISGNCSPFTELATRASDERFKLMIMRNIITIQIDLYIHFAILSENIEEYSEINDL